jgi:N-acetylglutamate synthase-like GNAT family acetyltransferase
MKEEIVIRKATEKDLKKIAEIYKIAFSEKPYNENWSSKTALERMTFFFKNKEIFVVENNLKLIGFIGSVVEPWCDAKRGIIVEMAIDKPYRKKGFGKMLVNYIEENYKKRGVKYMFVESMDETMDYFKKFNYKLAWNIISKELKW